MFLHGTQNNHKARRITKADESNGVTRAEYELNGKGQRKGEHNSVLRATLHLRLRVIYIKAAWKPVASRTESIVLFIAVAPVVTTLPPNFLFPFPFLRPFIHETPPPSFHQRTRQSSPGVFRPVFDRLADTLAKNYLSSKVSTRVTYVATIELHP